MLAGRYNASRGMARHRILTVCDEQLQVGDRPFERKRKQTIQSRETTAAVRGGGFSSRRAGTKTRR